MATLTVDQLKSAMLEGKYSALPPREVVSLTSSVVLTGGQEANLVLLDFSYPSSQAGDTIAIEILEALNLSGDLYDSGRSYHFVGSVPVDTFSMMRIMGQAALLSPLIDARWIAHQLVGGYCSLRISHDSERHPEPPRLVATSEPFL